MEAVHLLSFIPSDADNVRYYFGKVGNQNFCLFSRIMAVFAAMVCSAGNFIIYGFQWLVGRLGNLQNFYNSALFVREAGCSLICCKWSSFATPVQEMEMTNNI